MFHYRYAICITKHQEILQEVLMMNTETIRRDSPDIFDRLEKRAMDGSTSAELRLYRNQENKLLKEGFTVQRLRPVADHPGQNLCRIGWRYVAISKCLAHDLLLIAANHNAVLSQQLREPEDAPPLERPYETNGGWQP